MRAVIALGIAGGLLAHTVQAQEATLPGTPPATLPAQAPPGASATGQELPIKVGKAYSVTQRG